jgi:hypothetical protein
MLFADPAVNSVMSIVMVILGIILVVFVVMQISKFLVKIVVGLVANTILGFLALLIVNFVFGISIIYTLPVIISVVLFGLPAVGTILLLKILGGIAI